MTEIAITDVIAALVVAAMAYATAAAATKRATATLHAGHYLVTALSIVGATAVATVDAPPENVAYIRNGALIACVAAFVGMWMQNIRNEADARERQERLQQRAQ